MGWHQTPSVGWDAAKASCESWGLAGGQLWMPEDFPGRYSVEPQEHLARLLQGASLAESQLETLLNC